jgi:hypothetical protein
MSRYFFDTWDGDILLTDDHGQEAADPEAARLIAGTSLADSLAMCCLVAQPAD